MNKLIPVLLIVAVLVVAGMAIFRRLEKKEVASSKNTPSTQESLAAAENSSSPTSLTTPTSPTTEPVKEISLDVSQPVNNSTVTIARITLKGKTAPRAEVFVNEYDLKADSSGNFSYTLTLDEGENIIIVMANDENGNVAEKELIVTYEPSE